MWLATGCFAPSNNLLRELMKFLRSRSHPIVTDCIGRLQKSLRSDFVIIMIIINALKSAFGDFYNNIIIIIAFKGAIRDFLQSPHSATNCLHHVCSSGLGAIVCKSRATHRVLITCKCHVTCHLVRRDSSAIKFDRVEIPFI